MLDSSLRRRAATLTFLMLLTPGAYAESAYIAARVEVGLHEERSAHSAILELLPEGTEIEVLERDEDAARVRLGDGREGWVDSDYLSSEASAEAELAELRRRLPQLEAAVAREQAARVEAEGRRDAAREELVALREGLPAPGEDSEAAQEGGDSQLLRDFELLAEENRQLKEQIAGLEEAQAQAGSHSGTGSAASVPASRSGSGARSPGFFERPSWHWLLIGFVLLFAFGLGAYAVDWLTRRRHGGYRI